MPENEIASEKENTDVLKFKMPENEIAMKWLSDHCNELKQRIDS